MNAWELTRELISIMADIDRKIEEKSKTSIAEKWIGLDADIMRLESNMVEIINVLKTVKIV